MSNDNTTKPKIDEPQPGRVAKCSDCSKERPSIEWPSMFASWAPGSLRAEKFGAREKDQYYCGCRGWD
jgi:hypothetical protein